MDERRIQLIEYFTARCSMDIEEAKKKADINCNLQDELNKRDVRFKFLKKDGTIRYAYGTLHKDVIPPTMGTGRTLGFGLQLFFDLECLSYRSFKKENLISFE